MTVELFFIVVQFLLIIALVNCVLHLAKTIRQLRQYIGELERDLYNANTKLLNYDNRTTDHQ